MRGIYRNRNSQVHYTSLIRCSTYALYIISVWTLNQLYLYHRPCFSFRKLQWPHLHHLVPFILESRFHNAFDMMRLRRPQGTTLGSSRTVLLPVCLWCLKSEHMCKFSQWATMQSITQSSATSPPFSSCLLSTWSSSSAPRQAVTIINNWRTITSPQAH